MKKTASARFAIKSWDEKPVGDAQDEPKLTRAAVARAYSGEIQGEGHTEYVMTYRPNGSARFVGLERIHGSIGGAAGSFVLQRTGVFEDGVARESYQVVPGSASGALEGLRGEGTSAAGHGMEHPMTLIYELP